MSDNARQSLGDKFEAAVKVRPRSLLLSLVSCLSFLVFSQPDSQKSTTEHFGDKIKGNADSAMSSAQPQSEKSYTQQIGDTLNSNSNNDSVSFASSNQCTCPNNLSS